MSGLPAWISAALQDGLENVSRASLRERARVISDHYRSGGSSGIIASDLDALAYAVVRMPATFAALHAALEQVIAVVPAFAPQSVLDVGAGPGTATWAATEAWPTMRRVTLVDSNPHLLALAKQLQGSAITSGIDVSAVQMDISASLTGAHPAELIMASYVLGELSASQFDDVLAQLWSLTSQALVIVEPGTPAGFQRILHCRKMLLAWGAQLIAPCSHDGICPLAASGRWCHFGARLPRSRDHQTVKQAFVPYEDEKFSYLAAGKGFSDIERGRRILATPKITKAAIALSLCAPGKVDERVILRRQKDAYRAAKRHGWGDAINL